MKQSYLFTSSFIFWEYKTNIGIDWILKCDADWINFNGVRPQFSMETFKFFIEENQKPSVGFINATKLDQGIGGKLTNFLLTNHKTKVFIFQNQRWWHDFIHIVTESWVLKHYQVFVKDNRIPTLNNTGNVIVELTDKNDNTPYFTIPGI